MRDEEWFETDPSDELDDVQDAFLRRLRAHAGGWGLPPMYGTLLLPGDGMCLPPGDSGYGKVVAGLDVSDREVAMIVLVVGVHLDGDRVRGDELHNQGFTLPFEPTRLAFEATGSPEQLADRSAEWFETILRLPIERHEWLRHGRAYARQWVVAGVPKVVGGQVEEIRRRPPDRVVHVRGDRV